MPVWIYVALAGVFAGAGQPLWFFDLAFPAVLRALFALAGVTVLFLFMASARRKRDAAAYALVFWFVYFLSWGTWVASPLVMFVELASPLATLAAALVALLVAMVPCAGTFLSWWAAQKRQVSPLLVMPAGITLFELSREFIPFGGCPWGHIGLAFVDVPILKNVAILGGGFSLAFLALTLSAALASMAQRRQTGAKAAAAVAGIWVILGAAGGALPIDETGKVRIALLQASIPQKLINESAGQEAKIRDVYHRLQNLALKENPDVVVWPEAALLPAVSTDLQMVSQLGVYTEPPKQDLHIVAGGLARFSKVQDGRIAHGVYSTAHIVKTKADGQDKMVGRFDKVRLVPFGEYVPFPFGAMMSKQIVAAEAPLASGPGFKSLPLDDVKAGVTICWEGVFSGPTQSFVDDGADVMFNLSNDAWFPLRERWQHLQLYRLRALESGRPIARAANSGISAFVDVDGLVLEQSQNDEPEVLVFDLPLQKRRTPFSATGYLSLVVVACFWLVLVARTRQQSSD